MGRKTSGLDPTEDRQILIATLRDWTDFDLLHLYDAHGTPLEVSKIPKRYRLFIEPKGPVVTRTVWDGKKQISVGQSHPLWKVNPLWREFKAMAGRLLKQLEREEKMAPASGKGEAVAMPTKDLAALAELVASAMAKRGAK